MKNERARQPVLLSLQQHAKATAIGTNACKRFIPTKPCQLHFTNSPLLPGALKPDWSTDGVVPEDLQVLYLVFQASQNPYHLSSHLDQMQAALVAARQK